MPSNNHHNVVIQQETDSSSSSSSSTSTPTPPVEHYFDDHFVQEVRSSLLSMDHSQFDSIDVERLIQSDDWFIRRFLAWRPTTIQMAIKTLQQALIWRKEIQLNHWKDSDFPSEFYQVAACFRYLPDKENKNILILRMRFNKKEPVGMQSIECMIRNYFIYVVEKIVSQHPNQGFGIMFDCWKASLSNVDIDMARFIINVLSNYYSGAISYVYIYELPWILNQIWRLIRSWLDEEAKRIIRFITITNIEEYFQLENLPDYMGGHNRLDYHFVPKGVPSLEDIQMTQKLGIKSDKDVKRLTEHFQKLIKLK